MAFKFFYFLPFLPERKKGFDGFYYSDSKAVGQNLTIAIFIVGQFSISF